MAEDITLREETQDAVVDQPVVDQPEVVAEDHSTDPYFAGTWNGFPNYGCPYCPHKSLGGSVSIDEHIYDHHPEKSGLDFGENIGDQ